MADITTDQLTAYLAARMPTWHDLAIEGLSRLPMGASRETAVMSASMTSGMVMLSIQTKNSAR